MVKVLVADDDPAFCELVGTVLTREGFSVFSAHDVDSALRLWRQKEPSLVLIDITLGRNNGFPVLRAIRAVSNVPVIMMTGSTNENEVVGALELGADEYVQKPIQPRMFVARIRALLRRSGQPISYEPRIYSLDFLQFDSSTRLVYLPDGQRNRLTVLEARLLEHLLIHRAQILSYDSLINHVWGPDGADQDMLRQLVRRLRKKIEPDPKNPRYIKTVWGGGYIFAMEPVTE